jgi:hypothetical protein
MIPKDGVLVPVDMGRNRPVDAERWPLDTPAVATR